MLGRVYRLPSTDLISAIRALPDVRTIVMDRRAVNGGLPFSTRAETSPTAIIAYEGRWLGGEIFVSFERKVVHLLQGQNKSTQILA